MMRAALADARLEAVAGAPVATRTTAGKTQLDADPFVGRTLYAVWDQVNLSDASVPVASSGPFSQTANGGPGGFALRNSGGGESARTRLQNRAETLNGSGAGATESVFTSTGSLSAGRRYVCAAWMADGMLAKGIHLFGTAPVSSAMSNPGDGMPEADLNVNIHAQIGPVFAALYLAEHSEAQRLAVMRWLARRYGVTT